MKSHPILFSAPMVRAILEGRKSMTRRIMNPQPVYCENQPHWRWKKKGCKIGPFAIAGGDDPSCFGKYMAGDRLWVRETWAIRETKSQGEFNAAEALAWYRADGEREIKWRPSIFMPRWASRVTLEITDVKVERLQDISEEDAKEEGAVPEHKELYRCPLCGHLDHDEQDGDGHWEQGTSQTHSDVEGWSYWTLRCNGCGEISDMPLASAKEHFQRLWKAINGAGSWDANPWVWAVSFKKLGGGA